MAIARELTKTFETIRNMPLGELVEWVRSDENQQRGEMVLLVHGFREEASDEIPDEVTRSLSILVKELPLKKAAAMCAEIYNLKKNALYKWGLENLDN
ncbi:rRNA small subunit methyltransferase I [Vibrio astriarenae]|nr:rRNA small subunit methyltransferase I [Vibrio sp. C7]